MKVVLIYDGSFKGLLTSIYEVFHKNLRGVTISRNTQYSPEIFNQVVQVDTRPDHALKVWRALRLKAGNQGADRIYKAFLSELKGAENCILDYVIAAYNHEHFNAEDTSLSCVKKINHAAAMVQRSEDRSFEFIQESLQIAGRKWVSFSPDFNVLPLVAKRLKNLSGDQSWVVYDNKRGYGFRSTPEGLSPLYTSPVKEEEATLEILSREIVRS